MVRGNSDAHHAFSLIPPERQNMAKRDEDLCNQS